jgi:hypothetical protein
VSTANETGPAHYKRGTIEVWDFIRDQELNYFLGNVIKYTCRAGHKSSKREDINKAIHYLQKELETCDQPRATHDSFLLWGTGTPVQDGDGLSDWDAAE